MKVPVWILSLAAAVIVSVQGWTLHEVISLKVELGKLSVLVTRQASSTPAASLALRSEKNQTERPQ